jgi:spermidine synthase
MTAVPLAHRIYLAILVLGAYSQVVQGVLVREGLVVFYGNEVSLGAFYGSWLFWLAAGSFLVLRLRRRRFVREALVSVRVLLLSLPPLLFVQVLSLRGVRSLLEVSSSEFVPLGELLSALFFITIPSSLALGLAFPLSCNALRAEAAASDDAAAVRIVSRLYVADALGALGGGVLFTFVLIQWLGLVQTLGLVTLALGLTAWSLAPPPMRRGWGGLLLGVLGLLLAVPPAASPLERALEALRFATLQPGLELLDSVETRYGHVAVARLGEQISVVGDGQVRASFPLPREVARDAAYFYAQAAGPKRVLLFGGLAGGLAAELLRYPVERLDVVEQDRRAFEHVRPFLPAETVASLEDERLVLHFADGRRFVNGLPPAATYDLVLVLGASPSSAYGNRYFTREFYRGIGRHLGSRGVLCTRVSAASSYLGKEVGGYAGSVFHTLQAVFGHVAIAPGDEQIFCASQGAGQVSEEPVTLERRYLAAPLDHQRFPAAAFYSLLPAEETAYVRSRLEQAPTELNSDERPVTYYLNMVLWGKFSASGFVDWLEGLRGLGPWPYLLPPALFLALWLTRAAMAGLPRTTLERRAATLALTALGAIAMAAQLSLLLSYQSHVGFVFERVALLNGLFMTGLAVGAGVGARVARCGPVPLALLLLLSMTAGGLLLLPGVLAWLGDSSFLWQEWGYPPLAFALGLATGGGYPLGVHLAQRDLGGVVASGGVTQAADNLGGALGGLVTGALMVPLLGVGGTARVLAALALLAAVPLLFARAAPAPVPALRERGIASMPYPWLGWTMLFGVLLVYGFFLLHRDAAPGPRIQFDQDLLAQVSGSQRFDERASPFLHYLGYEAGSDEPETLVVSSAAAAPEVSGFAGPINLLLAVDRGGTLRGVRHLESNETPAYVSRIGAWLGGLEGLDLSAGPLAGGRVDAMSGATVTSRAALETIDRAASRGTEVVFGTPTPRLPGEPSSAYDAGFWVTLLLLLAFFPVYLSGSDRARLWFQLAALGVLGLWLNTLFTEVDLVNLSLGAVASPAENPQRWLLLAFVAVSGLLFGQVWCGFLCPFGALQELLSRLGRRLGLRSYPDRRLERRLRWLKYLLLSLMLTAVWIDDDRSWATFDPMQQVFGGRAAGWMLVIALVVLLGSVFYVRFWCRYFCPAGALLSLTNKLALLERLAPRRRFEHCDLGVRHTYDLDCIRCSRCLSGIDTRLLDEHADHRTGHQRGHGPGEHGLHAQGGDLRASLGRHGAKTAKHDPEASEVGEAAQGIGHDEAAARAQGAVRQGGELDVGQQLVEDGLDAHERTRRPGLGPGDADDPDHGRHEPAQDPLQAQGLTGDRGQQTE